MGRQKRKPRFDLINKRERLFVRLFCEEGKTRSPFVCDQNGSACLTREKQVGLPMSGLNALIDASGTQGYGNAIFVDPRHFGNSTSSPANGLSARQKKPPREVVRASDLSINEAIDGFMADNRAPFLKRQSA